MSFQFKCFNTIFWKLQNRHIMMTAIIIIISSIWLIGACVGDGSATAAASSSSLSGPVFLKEPSNRIDFSNTTGTVVECAATGNPRPEILWIKADGSPVTDVPGLRQVNNRKQLRFKTSKNIRRKYDVVFLNTLTMLVESPAFSPALLCLLPVKVVLTFSSSPWIINVMNSPWHARRLSSDVFFLHTQKNETFFCFVSTRHLESYRPLISWICLNVWF